MNAKAWAMIILALSLISSGCISRHFVDAKGRDCRNNGIIFPPIYWDTCEKKSEPLAKRIIAADINLNKQVEVVANSEETLRKMGLDPNKYEIIEQS